MRLVGEQGQGHARNQVLVDLEDEKLIDVLFDGLLGAVDEFLAFDRMAREIVDQAHVAPGRLANLLVIVAVDQGSHSLVGEDLVQQAVEHPAIEQVDPRGPGLDRLDGMGGLAPAFFRDCLGAFLERLPERFDRHLAAQFAAEVQTRQRREVDDLARLQHLGEFRGQQVRVDAQRVTVGREADRRHDRHDVGADEMDDELLVNAVDLAGELLLDALDDADRNRADRVRDGALESVLRQSLEDELRHAGGGPDGEVERGGVGHPRAMDVGDRDVARRRQFLDLPADAVNEDHLNPQAAENGDVDQQIAEVIVGDDRAVEGDDKNLPLKPGHVFQNAAEIRGLDVGDGGAAAHGDASAVLIESGGCVNGGVWSAVQWRPVGRR